jgi:hypothetical protein
LQDAVFLGPHNISSADTISITSSMAATEPEPMPTLHPEVCIRRRTDTLVHNADPPATRVFCPPGSGSTSQSYASG